MDAHDANRLSTFQNHAAARGTEHLGARPIGNLEEVPNERAAKPSAQSSAAEKMSKGVVGPPVFETLQDERLHRKQRLAAGFRLFSKFGFDDGVAGHITARDPEFKDTFWVNPFGMHFSSIKVSDLIRVDDNGNVVEGNKPVNAAAFAIHSRIHAARPEAVGAAHAHTTYGRAFAALGRKLDPISQDSCMFFNDHGLYDDFGGVAAELDEGDRIASALGKHKAAILQNHGLLTVGQTVDEAVWWFIAIERCCQVQLLAEASALYSGTRLKTISDEAAMQSFSILGAAATGWFHFQPLYERILNEQPDFLN